MKTHPVLPVCLVLCVLVACSTGTSGEPKDPVARLLTKRYEKVIDAFGAHQVTTNILAEGSGKGGASVNTLYEELSVDGSGNYHVTRREIEGGSPWELICIGSTYYVVSPDGGVQVLQPGMLGQTTRERVAESWRTVLETLSAGVKLVPTGREDVEGRSAVVYTVEYAESPAAQDRVVVQSVLGKIKVDQETGFPLFVDLKGSYTKAAEDGTTISVDVKRFNYEISGFGKVDKVLSPADRKKAKKSKKRKKGKSAKRKGAR